MISNILTISGEIVHCTCLALAMTRSHDIAYRNSLLYVKNLKENLAAAEISQQLKNNYGFKYRGYETSRDRTVRRISA